MGGGYVYSSLIFAIKKLKLHINYTWAFIAWLVGTTILLCLPGNDLPDIGWVEKWHVDKLIHITLFFGLVFLYANRIVQYDKRMKRIGWIVVAGILYGIAMEFLQKYLIPHRSFDVDDMIADAVGCCLAWFWQYKKWWGVYKKIGPDGNRGRNQN